jgi:hypothetical protein
VVVAEVDRGGDGMAGLLVRLVGQEYPRRKMNPELGGDPRHRYEAGDDSDRNAKPVRGAPRRERGAAPARGRDRQPERDEDAERGYRVDGAGVEIALIDDAGAGDDGAQRDRGATDPPCPAGQRGERQQSDEDRDDRDRVVELHEHTAEPSDNALVGHVAETLGLHERVDDENRDEVRAEERPHGERLALARSPQPLRPQGGPESVDDIGLVVLRDASVERQRERVRAEVLRNGAQALGEAVAVPHVGL